MCTDLSDAKFAVPVFEICAFDGKFGEHSLSDSVGPFAVSLLDHDRVVVRYAPWHL
jgi:hypothetical protein